jgi:hypothetical protein
MGNNIFEKLTEKYPFITLCMYANQEYVGVVQNRDDIVTTIYDLTRCYFWNWPAHGGGKATEAFL